MDKSLIPCYSRKEECMLQGMHQWERFSRPFTQPITAVHPSHMKADTPGLAQLLSTLGCAQRGLLVVAELTTAEDAVAALAISKSLGWPIVADALSGEGHTAALRQTSI